MENRKKEFSKVEKESVSHSQSQRPVGLMEAVAKTKERICYSEFGLYDRPIASEIVKILSETACLPAGCFVRIGGDPLPALLVQEVYELVGFEQVEYVIKKFRGVQYKIRSTKAYLRTALYNSVFEMETALENEINSEGM
jgi:hypothetical protein